MGTLHKVRDLVIYRDGGYNAFPIAVTTEDERILVAFRQAPNRIVQMGNITHVDPSARAVYVSSRDHGVSWDEQPTIIYDDFLVGVHEPCLARLQDGTLYGLFYAWKVFDREDMAENPDTDHKLFDRWLCRLDRMYSIRSTNGGSDWEAPQPAANVGQAVRGVPVQLKDGSLLVSTYGEADNRGRVIISKSEDLGASWTRVAQLENENYHFYEPFLYVTPSGKIVALLRSNSLHGPDASGRSHPLFTSESLDGGLSWSDPVMRRVFSPSPFHALRLQSGKVLINYGYRYQPAGVRAFLLDSECEGWDDIEEIVLRDDGIAGDLGYTSAVQLANGDILIAYYFYDEPLGDRYIAGTICREA
ncbi:exo-alpha-sialidase [Paenibacillus senegalensis]|uniref:exo-alpha-sialidase n=1 Tax=Paenibacillus senegalensis TaxID=1465766 RepID=UPI0002887227|nr:exo-alpha-sialidase [Paenibacillus senegalensis]